MPSQRVICSTGSLVLRISAIGATAVLCCALIIYVPLPPMLWPVVLASLGFALGCWLGPSLTKAELFWAPVGFALVAPSTVFVCTERTFPPGPLWVAMLIFGAGAAAAVASGRAFRQGRRWRYPFYALAANFTAGGLVMLALLVLVGPP
jgi:hypothetical protein